jgi:hypothetical protein
MNMTLMPPTPPPGEVSASPIGSGANLGETPPPFRGGAYHTTGSWDGDTPIIPIGKAEAAADPEDQAKSRRRPIILKGFELKP